jgi:hypothetical protein
VNTNLAEATQAANQAAQTAQQILPLALSLFSTISVALAALGRWWHARQTGGSVFGGIFKGTNAPVLTPAPAQPANPPPNPNIGLKLSVFLIFVGLISFALAVGITITSCASLAPGADPLVVRVEQTETTAKSTFDLVLNEDNSNRPFWMTNAPAFHAFCEWLRQPQTVEVTNTLPRASAMLLSLDDVKVAYQASKTAGNSNLLYTIVATTEAAVSQASAWITIATNTPTK